MGSDRGWHAFWEADIDYSVPHATATIYGYWRGLGLEGFQWFYDVGAGVGAIPTNDGETCVFASLPQARFENGRGQGLDALYHDVLKAVSMDLGPGSQEATAPEKLRAFAALPAICDAQPVPDGRWSVTPATSVIRSRHMGSQTRFKTPRS